jgi:putative DNA primase/helicase
MAAADEFTRRLIDEIWSECHPSFRGCVVDRYLRNRGIELEIFPDDVRFHRRLAYYADRREADEKAKVVGYYPAMVCAMRDGDGNIQALHRTYLSNAGVKITDALPNHAEVKRARKVLGRTEGLSVRLGEAGETLIVGEGIESCLAASLLLGFPAWSSYSASNLPNMVIPDSVKHVIIAGDNDKAGRLAVSRLAQRLVSQRVIQITAQFAEGVGNDWADVI